MSITNYLKAKIKESPKWKARIHNMIFYNARPRLWIKILINPFYFRHGKGSCIRRQCVINVSPINNFRVGNYSTIEEYCIIDNGVGTVLIGNYTRIGLRSTVIGPIEIGNHVILAQNVVLSGLNHKYEDIEMPIHEQGVNAYKICIEDDVWVGANSVITSGIRVGKHAVIAAGSVVTKDVEAYTVVAGIPAKPIKRYNEELKQWVKV